MSPDHKAVASQKDNADAQLLQSMGYSQELARRMSGFSNFAVSFSIICILSGGITAFPAALGAGGGLSVGLGWLVGSLFALVVAAAMAQISSAFPTAGGLYHWSSILGGKGYGWATAWFNLIGLVFVMAAVNFGVYDPFFKTFVAPLLGIDASKLGWIHQTGFIALVTLSQAWMNHRGIGIVSKLTDLSGYLIFIIAIVLVGSLLVYSPVTLDFSRLTTFTNFTGADGSWWPKSGNTLLVFLSGLLLTVYTITGFDASAHTSEETHDAARNVPKGILSSVFWSGVFGWVMVCVFVLVMPNLQQGVKQGADFFGALLNPLPGGLKVVLGLGLFVVNYLCGLAGLTSTSRMMYAFARDGGMPASGWLRQVSATHRTPGPAIWVSAVLIILATLYADAFVVLSTAAAVLLYISYIMPTAAGIFAEGRSWTKKGPYDLKGWSKPIAVLAVIGGATLVFVGVQPPNDKVLYLCLGLSGLLLVFWWVFGVRGRFQGPPVTAATGQKSAPVGEMGYEEV
jgi:amino acid transporter